MYYLRSASNQTDHETFAITGIDVPTKTARYSVGPADGCPSHPLIELLPRCSRERYYLRESPRDLKHDRAGDMRERQNICYPNSAYMILRNCAKKITQDRIGWLRLIATRQSCLTI